MNKPTISLFTKAKIRGKEQAILDLCKGRKVLDVGCVGQDKPAGSSDWLHGKVKSVTAELTGVDINTEKISVLNREGYHILTPEVLQQSEKKFEVVLMADVIEHVDDVAAFLKYYLKFLQDDGKMIITTPNPYSIRQTASIFLYGQPGINPEHTAGLDPITMIEVFARQNLSVNYFCWLHEYSMPSKFRYKILFPLFRLIYRVRKYFAPNFLFVVSR